MHEFSEGTYDAVVIDAGHGGEDGGAVAEDGTVTAVGAGSAYVQYVNSGDLTAESSVLITVK